MTGLKHATVQLMTVIPLWKHCLESAMARLFGTSLGPIPSWETVDKCGALPHNSPGGGFEGWPALKTTSSNTCDIAHRLVCGTSIYMIAMLGYLLLSLI